MISFPFSVHILSGHSMQPAINDGDRVIVSNWAYLFLQPKVGDVVVFSSSDGKRYAKRITAVANKNELIVEGDNKSDSRKLPPILKKAIIGKVIAMY